MNNTKKLEKAPIFDREENRLFENHLRDLFDTTPYLIFSIDFQGRLLSANAAFLETYGLGAAEIKQLSIFDHIDEEFKPLIEAKLVRRQQGSQNTTPYQLLTHTKSGYPVWIEISTMLIREKEKLIGIQCVARDISAQREAELSLQKSELRFRETVELLPGVICEMDLSSNLTYVNQAAMDTFGFTKEEFEAGLNALDLVHDEDKERAVENLREIMEKRKRRFQSIYRLQKKDGKTMEMLVNSSPLMSEGQTIGVRSCLLDITELRYAERKLRKSEERFRRMFNVSPIGIALTDQKGKVTDMNGYFGMMFGLKGTVEKQRVLVFDLARVDASQEELLEAGTGIECRGWCSCNTEQNCVENGEERRYLEWYITPLTGNGEERSTKEILVQVKDVTERKKAEEATLAEVKKEAEQARSVIRSLREQITEKSTFRNMVSRSKEMQKIFGMLPNIAETMVTVLVTGESGTGKELIARSLHELSPRKHKPFVAINCSALPDNLLESELFGYKAGAFTDAKKDKPGKFALAEGGTIFLDEIGDISPAMQVKLLRVIQEKSYEPLGGTKSIEANVRIVCATNKDLKEMVAREEFRQDLFYRINVLNIKLPSLKERISDIPVLCEHFIRKFNTQYNRQIREISQRALDALLAHEFPGNIRELENILEHAFVFCNDSAIDIEHLPSEITGEINTSGRMKVLSNVASFADLERLYIQSILAETEGNKIEAAKRLGVHKTTFFRKLKKLRIES